MFEQLVKFDSILGGLLGLVGGIVTVLVWEIFLRPAREGRALAEVLAAEVSFNLQYLSAASLKANRSGIGSDFTASTSVFDNTVDKIGVLPPQLVHEVVFLYKYFSELNGYPKAYGDTLREYRGYEPGSANKATTERELDLVITVFRQTLEKAIKRIELVQPLLLKAARPWWSLRGWRSPKAVSLNLEELGQRMARSEGERKGADPKR